VFEGLRGYWNDTNQQLYIFRLEDHAKRLLNSIKMMRFEDKYSYEYLIESLKATVIKNNYKEDIAIRQTVFLDGNGSWFATSPINMFIAPIVKKEWLPRMKTDLVVVLVLGKG
tara:strand:- start:400 stop:738 length:339 start_codon:yes stop_codon:yes gene_type:complete